MYNLKLSALAGAACTLLLACGGQDDTQGLTETSNATEVVLPEGLHQSTWPCPSCGILSDIHTSPYTGDLYRAEDSSFASWGDGEVGIRCDDGSVSAYVVIDGLDPFEIADGIDLQDIPIPAVDFESSSLACKIEVVTDDASTTIDLLVE